MKNGLLFLFLALNLISFRAALADSPKREFECQNFGGGVGLGLADDGKEGVVQFSYFDSVDPGSVFHHAPILLPSGHDEPFPVKVREEGHFLHYETETFDLALDLRSNGEEGWASFQLAKVLKGAPNSKIGADPTFECRPYHEEDIVRPGPPPRDCSRPRACH